MFRLTLDTYWLKVTACILVEQSLRASSLVWSLFLLERVFRQAPVLSAFVAFSMSIFLPFALGMLRGRIADAWQIRLYKSVIDEYARAGRHTLSDWFDDDRRDRDVPFMASEAHQIVSHTVEWFQTLTGHLTHVVFHIAAMWLLFSASFGAAYGVAFFLGLAMSRWFEVRGRRMVNEDQNAQAAISMRLLGSWDNIVLGNVYNRKNWERKVKEELETLGAVRRRILGLDSLRASAVFLVVVVPVAVQIFRYFDLRPERAFDPQTMATLLVTIPFVWFALERFPNLFASIHARRRNLENISKIDETLGQPSAGLSATQGPQGVSPAEEDDEGPHVEWQSLAFLNQGVVERLRGMESLPQLTGQFRPGRYVVLGPSGSGKTTLMLMLKGHYPSQSFYFPGQNTLVFDSETESLFDPVQKLIACLQRIRENSEGGIVLLDDWDVYLDAWSAEQVSQVIDDISQVRCVIETRRVNLSEI
ncbi:MAG: hypothetical protein IOD12_14595 [Silvanigrellales bacterium]|jgi:ABC-type multidrug transport system fused ATPase/permease subunit|nr:hypothetical protein [Silvanigrellales bacterium]